MNEITFSVSDSCRGRKVQSLDSDLFNDDTRRNHFALAYLSKQLKITSMNVVTTVDCKVATRCIWSCLNENCDTFALAFIADYVRDDRISNRLIDDGLAKYDSLDIVVHRPNCKIKVWHGHTSKIYKSDNHLRIPLKPWPGDAIHRTTLFGGAS